MALTGIEAVRDKIRVSDLAKALTVTPGAVSQWERVPAERLGDVARITGLSPEVIRPDLFLGVKRRRPRKTETV
jgi:DNA-binding transcriptional regulator YdaS (Cro superfamily)